MYLHSFTHAPLVYVPAAPVAEPLPSVAVQIGLEVTPCTSPADCISEAVLPAMLAGDRAAAKLAGGGGFYILR